MRMSEETKKKAYGAINEPIIDLRIELAKNKHDPDVIDNLLFQLNQKIWRELCLSLNICEQGITDKTT